MKNLAVFLVSLAFAANALAQTPATEPIQMAQAGSSAGGAAPGAAASGAASGATAGIVAIIAAGVAAVAAVTAYSSTAAAPNH